MNTTELEKRLEKHARIVKDTMAAPFDAEMEVLLMKNKKISSKKIISLIAIAAVLACLTTAFAAGGLGGWHSHHTSKFDNIHNNAPLAKELGFAPVLIERFENGYSFVDGTISDNQITDDDGSVKEEFRSAFMTYARGDDELMFSQDRSDSVVVDKGEIMGAVDGIDIYYYGYTNKFVPEDYQMTEEDKAAEESGELIFSWGSDEVMVKEIRSVQWKADGIACMLMQMDGKLTADELTEMAKEAIAAASSN